MKCPRCGGHMKVKRRQVVHEKHGKGEPQVWKLWECQACGKRVTAREE